MLEAIGSKETAKGNNCCCDSCGIAGLAPKLHFESHKPVSTVGRKRRTAVYAVTDDVLLTLKQSLRLERDRYHPNYMLFGPDSICSDSLIDNVCTQAKFIKVEEDLNLFSHFYCDRYFLKQL